MTANNLSKLRQLYSFLAAEVRERVRQTGAIVPVDTRLKIAQELVDDTIRHNRSLYDEWRAIERIGDFSNDPLCDIFAAVRCMAKQKHKTLSDDEFRKVWLKMRNLVHEASGE